QVPVNWLIASDQWGESTAVAEADEEDFAGIDTVYRKERVEGILIGSEFGLKIGLRAGRALAIANAGLINSHRDETRAAGDFIHQLGETIAPHARLFDRIATQPSHHKQCGELARGILRDGGDPAQAISSSR